MRIILQLADGASYSEIQEGLGVAATTIARWKKRYEEDGLAGLATVHPGQPLRLFTPELRAKILALVREPPPDGSTHWSLRKAAKVLKVGKDLIRKAWKEVDLRPHRLDRYKASDDPEFESKAADIGARPLVCTPLPSLWMLLVLQITRPCSMRHRSSSYGLGTPAPSQPARLDHSKHLMIPCIGRAYLELTIQDHHTFF
jgi:transposase